MPRKKAKFRIESYGRYTAWDRNSKELPRILEFTETIEATEGNEFGMIIKIESGKGERLDFCIKHPPFKDTNGNIAPDFTGEYYVKSNKDYFFIGDCIWLPLEDKKGNWVIEVFHGKSRIASKNFKVV